jgi:L-lactate utilization protein LutB
LNRSKKEKRLQKQKEDKDEIEGYKNAVSELKMEVKELKKELDYHEKNKEEAEENKEILSSLFTKGIIDSNRNLIE